VKASKAGGRGAPDGGFLKRVSFGDESRKRGRRGAPGLAWRYVPGAG